MLTRNTQGKSHHRVSRALAVEGGLLTAGVLVLSGCAAQPAGAEDSRERSASQQAAPEPAETVPVEPSEAERAQATADLFAAIQADDFAAGVAAVDAGAYLDMRGDQGRTALVAATKLNRVNLALHLLEAGADPNNQDDIQDSAFLYAGAEGFNEILAGTLAHGAEVTSTNRFGGTALIPASEHGYVETVQMLIRAGVPLDHVNNLGWTALHEAIVLNDGGQAQIAVVEALLSAGASPTLPDGNGASPRQLALNMGYWGIVDVIDRYL